MCDKEERHRYCQYDGKGLCLTSDGTVSDVAVMVVLKSERMVRAALTAAVMNRDTAASYLIRSSADDGVT